MTRCIPKPLRICAYTQLSLILKFLTLYIVTPAHQVLHVTVGFISLGYSVVCTNASLSLFISFLYLDLYILGDDLWISYVSSMQIKHLCLLIHIRLTGEVGTFLLFVFVFAILSCLFLAALWTLLALLYVAFLCFVTFPYVVLGQVWYLIVSIPDLFLLPYFFP